MFQALLARLALVPTCAAREHLLEEIACSYAELFTFFRDISCALAPAELCVEFGTRPEHTLRLIKLGGLFKTKRAGLQSIVREK